MNRKGVGSEEVPLSEKMTNLPFFWVVSCIEPLLERASRSCLEQDGASIFWMVIQAFWIASRLIAKEPNHVNSNWISRPRVRTFMLFA